MGLPQRLLLLAASHLYLLTASAQHTSLPGAAPLQAADRALLVAATPVLQNENAFATGATVVPDTLPSSFAGTAEKPWLLSVETRATGTTGGAVPFWMRANQYGSIPLEGASGSLVGRVERRYNAGKPRFLDWGMALEGRANGGKGSNATLIEGFLKIKLGPFHLRGGRVKEFNGLVDSSLSTGAFSLSGNALGVPKVEISVPEFYHFFGSRLLAFKGNIAHGWLGEVRRNKLAGTGTDFTFVSTYLHQKSFYGRLGKDHWKVRLYGGFNHQAFWGNEKKRYGNYYSLSTWETFLYVLRGKMWEGISSKIGNHLGSVDVGMELNFRKTSLYFYRQNFYDIGALYYLANIADGLHGLRIVNKAPGRHRFQWKKILVEVLYSKNQAGEPWSRDTKSGAEDYYNSSEYLDGWSYKGLALGTPFMSTRSSTRSGFPSAPNAFFNNNRVLLLHTGVEGNLHGFDYTLKLSYSRNYGTWAASSYGKRTGGSNQYFIPPLYGIFQEVSQFSSYLSISKAFGNRSMIGGAFALDRGGLLYHSAGVELRYARSF